jgi:hypothetical protein
VDSKGLASLKSWSKNLFQNFEQKFDEIRFFHQPKKDKNKNSFSQKICCRQQKEDFIFKGK